MRLRRWALLALGAGAAWLLGCGDETPSSLGSGLRTPPDSLHVLELRAVAFDSVYPIPVSLGRSPVAQLGHRFVYTSHVLYNFEVPTRTIRDGETLSLDEAHLVIRTDSILLAPFTGSMRLGLQEVTLAGRSWATEAGRDSVIATLPPLEPDPIARDTVIAGAALANRSLRLDFTIQLNRIIKYDSLWAAGASLTVNCALLFRGFDTPGQGFLEYTHAVSATTKRAQVIGFAIGENDAIATVDSKQERLIVEFASTAYSPGTKLAVSDGYRLHSFLQFPALSTVLPDSALVFRSDLVLTQVDTLTGTSFGDGPRFGVIVPRDSLPFDKLDNELPLSFQTGLVALPGSLVSMAVTPYIFDQQEGNVPNRGMILRLSNEGTKARHFEFYGGAAADSLRPRLVIYYGFPAQFEGGEH